MKLIEITGAESLPEKPILSQQDDDFENGFESGERMMHDQFSKIDFWIDVDAVAAVLWIIKGGEKANEDSKLMIMEECYREAKFLASQSSKILRISKGG